MATPRRRRLLTQLLVVLAVLSGAVIVSASPAAASCSSVTYKYYPGSATGRVRYAEVDFHFDLCNTDAPSQWQASVSKAQVNATGKNLGFVLDGTSIPTDQVGSYYHYWTGYINASTCTPRIEWPCSSSYTFWVQFNATLDRYGNVQLYPGSYSAPIGMALFTTP